MATHSSTLSCLENPMDRRAWCPWDRKESDTTERLHFHLDNYSCSLLLHFEQSMPPAKQSPPSKQLDSWISFFVIVMFPQMFDCQCSKNRIPASLLGGNIRLIYILSSMLTFSPQRTHLKGAKTDNRCGDWCSQPLLRSIKFILVYARDWMSVRLQNSHVKVLTPGVLIVRGEEGKPLGSDRSRSSHEVGAPVIGLVTL